MKSLHKAAGVSQITKERDFRFDRVGVARCPEPHVACFGSSGRGVMGRPCCSVCILSSGASTASPTLWSSFPGLRQQRVHTGPTELHECSKLYDFAED